MYKYTLKGLKGMPCETLVGTSVSLKQISSYYPHHQTGCCKFRVATNTLSTHAHKHTQKPKHSHSHPHTPALLLYWMEKIHS